MTNSLAILINVREIRETSAGARVKKCQARHLASLERQRRRESNLDKYRYWRLQQESKLFEEIQNNLVNIGTLESFRLKIDKLGNQEIALDDRVQKAKNSVRSARKNLISARKTYNQAMKANEKLKEYSAIQNREAERRNLRIEEIELDELVAINPGLR